ncbi:hypothetical protein [Pediococcus argentinicus]|uniref:Uncharacterized protein n=1 Tax=Pediococcus argentinicus TaxID=480391 RepID=A0A0R2NN76_9LACO|nr:hypothetical protein [Pediococcus argentinicus]KRO26290.1 hypothetical protein IV88_GL000075 [Pediococcus argentinicus]NKZ21518.1 hypothetical protein [Pediococcus argentinicus]GEP18683.1 hypothetical protein LSA03_00670 [Pediococcus argentinicus]
MNDNYKLKDWAPKFNKKGAELMRSMHVHFDNQNDGQEFQQIDFNNQQEFLKNNLTKTYQIKLLTSFNERCVWAVVGKSKDNSKYFWAIDRQFESEISVDQLKKLFS